MSFSLAKEVIRRPPERVDVLLADTGCINIGGGAAVRLAVVRP
jgi:hypothetical protein